ncbi:MULTISPECIES: amino acid ABC transporter ATP-binding protein [unclassified Sedimentibacter]|uniref:amino acid ABC transporter ATP-binding protein n=1 Tax=unclassified Sedimentibacter TaxID=2649220 RepID=UPI0027E070DA|nr:amino acid ABC transporter ATP-binding protein [Sedimentibacter sp. MB35-C1]WMJ76038.1 amino acid ABC transporter ATP-binding protein [Sedimentibacter sp. MB35-C1]
MGKKIIEVGNLSKSYGDTQVLKSLNMQIETGEVVAIIGSSGSGKSTLVRCIAGLEKIDGGEILLGGQRISGTKSTNGKVGMVFQNFNLFPHYRVGENVSMPLKTVLKYSNAEAEEKSRMMLDRVHMLDKLKQYPNNLSGGQQQRVAIARALALGPEVMIFDEPTSSLDPELSHEVFETISDLAKEGQTMLIVTHQINAVRRFATRIVFLSKGKIEVEGTPDYIFNQSENYDLKHFLKQVSFEDI